ncbi:MAG TPA: branched-chain amino acid ABC transporter ATP-binding protein/permease [Trueperaceae bacterium]
MTAQSERPALPRRRHLPWRALLTGVFLLAVLVAPLLVGSYEVRLLSLIGLDAMVVVGLVLLTGYAGLASLGQAAFVGTGAYAAAILASRFDLNPWLGILAGILVSVLIAWLIGLVTLRLRGHFLALATLAWGLVITSVLRNWIEVTGGNTGFGSATGNRFPPLPFFRGPLLDYDLYYYLIWAAALAVIWGCLNLMGSRVGRAIKSLRTGAVAAASFGVDVQRLKMTVFLLAAAFAALSGGLFAFRELFLAPGIADLEASIDYLIMAVLGGIGSIWGAVFGSALFILLEEALQDFLPRVLGRTGNFEAIAFGLILIVVLHRARRGLLPLLARLLPPAPPPRLDPDARPLPKRTPLCAPGPLLEIREISRTFGGLRAVDRLSFEVLPGEILGLIGPNGAGKTTAFNLVTGVLAPDEGSISFAGTDIAGKPPHRIARLGLSRTFQHLNLIGDMTLLENAALGAYTRTESGLLRGMLALDRGEDARTKAEAYRQLERVGLAEQAFDRADSLPLGKQRLLEVARALMADPVLLLLDEPAAGLRRHEKVELSALIRRLRDEGATILLVEHDMDVVMGLADRIVVMNEGRKLAEGTPEKVRRDERVLEAYLGVEAA